MPIKVKRVYEPASRGDGVRILVDRLWPRGIRKSAIDLWLKDVAPSTALREWFDHVPARWPSFRAKYRRELSHNPDAVRELKAAAKGKTVTLLYGARDTMRNEAVVLAAFLKKRKPPTRKVPKKA